MLTVGGFGVIALGADVRASAFIEKVRELKPDILGLSALLSATALKQQEVAEALTEAVLREKVKLIVGRAAVTRERAEKIGADGSRRTPSKPLEVSKKLLQQ